MYENNVNISPYYIIYIRDVFAKRGTKSISDIEL